MDEQAAEFKKRKREEDEEEADPSAEGAKLEDSSAKLIQNLSENRKRPKKQKREDGEVTKTSEAGESAKPDGSAKDSAKAAKAREKKLRKKEKVEKQAAKIEAKKIRKEQKKALAEDSNAAAVEETRNPPSQTQDEAKTTIEGLEGEADETESVEMDAGFAAEDFVATASPSPETEVSTFDPPNQDSGSSSISSIVPPPTNKPPSLPTIDTSNDQTTAPPTTLPTDSTPPPDSKTEGLKARLAARIEALRTARKATDPSQGPTNRQELIETRRRKEEERKAHKKALRRKAREDEIAASHAENLARASPLLSNTNSPLLSPGSPATSTEHNNFSFSRISFPNGARVNASLDAILTPQSKPKGPSDPHTALLAASKRQSRLAALDPEKAADIAEKDVWLNARKRAHGERVRDDTSLLKKTLKRKEKQKKKSEREWKERLEGVEKGKEGRQKKREGNLRKRREDKGGKGGGKGKGAGGKKKARPGFEGSFKTKAPSGGGGAVAVKPRRR